MCVCCIYMHVYYTCTHYITSGTCVASLCVCIICVHLIFMFVHVGLQRIRQELNGYWNLGLQLPQNPPGGVQESLSILLPLSSSKKKGNALV